MRATRGWYPKSLSLIVQTSVRDMTMEGCFHKKASGRERQECLSRGERHLVSIMCAPGAGENPDDTEEGKDFTCGYDNTLLLFDSFNGHHWHQGE
jgi:hypothetical protein